MKYCSHCGAEVADEAVVCVNCGCAVSDTHAKEENNDNILKTVAKIFMLITCITTGWALIPLCWTVPMTVKYWNDVKLGRPTSTAFKVCTLLFVNTIAGILMLCDNSNN